MQNFNFLELFENASEETIERAAKNAKESEEQTARIEAENKKLNDAKIADMDFVAYKKGRKTFGNRFEKALTTIAEKNNGEI
jgi:hypothetical protein